MLWCKHDAHPLPRPLDVTMKGGCGNRDGVQLSEGLTRCKRQRHLQRLGQGQGARLAPWRFLFRLIQRSSQRRFCQLRLALKHPSTSPPIPSFPLQVSRIGQRGQALNALVPRSYVVQQSGCIPHLQRGIGAIQTQQLRHPAMCQLPLPFIEGLHGLCPDCFGRHIPLSPNLTWHAHRSQGEPHAPSEEVRLTSAN